MKITCNNQPSFGAKFVNTQSFREVVKFAEQNKKLGELDVALRALKNANEGDIMLIHGITPQNISFSNFCVNRKLYQSVCRHDAIPAEASFYNILELAKLDRVFKNLFGNDVHNSVKAEDIIKEYVVK